MTSRKLQRPADGELGMQAIILGECARELAVISGIGIFIGEHIGEGVPHEWVRWLGLRAEEVGERIEKAERAVTETYTLQVEGAAP